MIRDKIQDSILYRLMLNCMFGIIWGKLHKKRYLSWLLKNTQLHIICRQCLMCMLHIGTFWKCI